MAESKRSASFFFPIHRVHFAFPERNSPKQEELEILACRKKASPTAAMNSHWQGQNRQQPRQSETGYFGFGSHPWSECLWCWDRAMGCWDNPSSPVRECFIPSAKLSATTAFRERNPSNLLAGPEREKGRAGQQPLLPPSQLRGESLLHLTLCIDDSGIWEWSTSYSFWNTFLLLPEKQYFPLLGTAGFFKAHRSWVVCF